MCLRYGDDGLMLCVSGMVMMSFMLCLRYGVDGFMLCVSGMVMMGLCCVSQVWC